jgi:hypothetical protein
VVALVATSAPLALGFETLLRGLLPAPELEGLRRDLGPLATDAAWALAASCAAASGLGLWLQRRWCLRGAEDARARGGDLSRALADRTFLSMSAPQVPAILATFAFTWGSAPAPVIAAMVISSLGVLAQGAQWEWLIGVLRRAREHAG